jgi:hypothetical protein
VLGLGVDLALAAVPLVPGSVGVGIKVATLRRLLFLGRLFVSASADKLIWIGLHET